MEDNEDGVVSLFLHQIIGFALAHFAPTPVTAQLGFQLHNVALDSGSESRYVRRQGCGLEI